MGPPLLHAGALECPLAEEAAWQLQTLIPKSGTEGWV